MSQTGKRVRIVVRGEVQGVCFRMYVQHQARELGLTGWAANRPDGSVEVCAEGREADVAALVAWCRHGPPTATVRAMDVREEGVSGEFADFRIKR